MKKKKSMPNIDPTDDYFGCVLNCAVRYSIGRRTYMPKLVMDFISPLLPYISDKTLYNLEKDVRGADNYGDTSVDFPDWMNFLSKITAEVQRRADAKGVSDIDLLTNSNDRM